MMLHSFRHEAHAQRVVLTDDAADALHQEMQSLKLRRGMLACSPRAAFSPLAQRVKQMLGKRCVMVFTEVVEHPTLSAVERGALRARALQADCLISLGGGSAVDLAKGIAMQVAEQQALLRFAHHSPVGAKTAFQGEARLLPILAVPGTLSGAECTPTIGLRDDDGNKLIIRDARCIPRVIVLDPIAHDAPLRILLATGINAIAHCIEALYSLARDPVSDAYATQGFLLLQRSLHALLDDAGDDAARTEAYTGAHLAGRAIVNARTGLHHAACHVIGATGVPHGVANAIMLPHAIAFNAMAAGSLLAGIARQLAGASLENPAATVAHAARSLSERAGLPQRLRDAGIQRERIPDMAASIMREPGLRYNPRQDLTLNDVAELLRAAW